MSKIKVCAFGVSLDGFGAGPDQDHKNPLGVGGPQLMGWFMDTPTFRKNVLGASGGTPGIDEDFAARSFENMGAWILGRNMFGPVRGPWPDDSWKGWWGDDPPYHVPTYVLTHHARAPIPMKGGTTFHFVTDGLKSALKQAKDAAKGKDVRIGGGVSVVRQCLEAGVIDEMHLAVSPVLLGRGENLLGGINLVKLGFKVVENVASAKTMHVVLRR